ncbi:hypothetical protein [Microscilla marina]|uniref:Lipoprotein n=1 Tax=Microscilla marina ATCC 23134 TaxID=313606 RepID=A1ZZ59_MICM2|nr:hypothetical protein [Microscilla marina]EAY24318.1 hypothetical protein M23134_05944 [Microscilla marina ATCC 23134]
MKMRKMRLLLGLVAGLFLGTQSMGQAQNKKVRYIQDLYYYIKDKITQEKYYINEYNFNSTGKGLPKQGDYKRFERYFYSFSGKAAPTIRTITIKTVVKKTLDYEEFLYDLDGQLIFYYEKRNDKKKLYGEISIYFNKGKAIHIVKDRQVFDKTTIDQNENFLKLAWNKGNTYHKKFDTQMARYRE